MRTVKARWGLLPVILHGWKSERRTDEVLRRYLLPGPGVHETGEVAGVGGSDHDIVVRVLVQDGGLGGEDDVGVEGLVRGGGLTLFAGVGPEARGEPHDLRGD